MAVGTVTIKYKNTWGSLKVRVVDVVGSGSYTSNGDALTAGQLGLRNVFFAQVTSTTGWSGRYDITNSKLLAFGDGANTGTTTTSSPAPQAASTTDLSGTTFRVFAVGN